MASGIASALVAVCGCGSVDCPTSACSNSARLTGTIAASTLPTLVDMSFCSQGMCLAGSIALQANQAQASCTMGNSSTGVCLLPKDGGILVTATWSYGENQEPPPESTTYQLQLTDHSTGASLLDVTRNTRYHATSVIDDCQRCWSAEMSL